MSFPEYIVIPSSHPKYKEMFANDGIGDIIFESWLIEQFGMRNYSISPANWRWILRSDSYYRNQAGEIENCIRIMFKNRDEMLFKLTWL
jgi:hypothetical protein